MKKFTIMADATCDLGEDLGKEYHIEVVPTHIMLPDGRDIPSFHKWEEFSREEFYNKLKANPDGYATAPPNVAEFVAAYKKAADRGEDILLLTISAGMSGTFDFATQAKKEMEAEYPDTQIRVIDSLRFGPALGLLAMYAAKKRDEGLSLDETADYIENNKNKIHQAGWLDDLSFVAKKGRMTHAKAFFGSLAGIKPIGEFDYNGMTTVIGKAKGAKAAYELLLKYIEKTIRDPQDQVIIIAHTNRLEQAEIYSKMIEEKFHPKAVLIRDVFPMCGISIGPGLMAAYYAGNPISQGLVEEKAILEACQQK